MIRSGRKTLCIEVGRDGVVTVRAPRRCPQPEVASFVQRKQQWIEQMLERQTARTASFPEPTPEEAAVLRAAAQQAIPQRVAFYAGLMGLSPTGVRITAAKTRFGSCSAKNSLCFSFRLMRYPQQAIDYVVVHELAHICHKNHGSAFHALVRSVLPDERERRALLRK